MHGEHVLNIYPVSAVGSPGARELRQGLSLGSNPLETVLLGQNSVTGVTHSFIHTLICS